MKDWELVHRQICTVDADQRKVKAGKEDRNEAGAKKREDLFQDSLKSSKSEMGQDYLRQVFKASCGDLVKKDLKSKK